MWLEGVCGRVCFGHPLTLSDHSRTALLFGWGVRDQRGSSTSTLRAGDFKFLATHSQEENGNQSGKEKCRKEGGTLRACWAGGLGVRWELEGRQGRARKIRPWRTGLWDSLSSVKANLSLRLDTPAQEPLGTLCPLPMAVGLSGNRGTGSDWSRAHRASVWSIAPSPPPLTSLSAPHLPP